MTIRTRTILLHTANDTTTNVVYELASPGYTTDTLILPRTIVAERDPGDLTLTRAVLWCDQDSLKATRWSIKAGTFAALFDLSYSDGADVYLPALLTPGSATVPTTTAQALIDDLDARIDVLEANTGSGGSTPTLARLAATALGGHRVVELNSSQQAMYATPSTVLAVLGVTTGAAAAGATVAIQTSGELLEPSWAWQPGPVYLGANGTLTQTPPTSGALVQIGIASAPTRLLIAIQPPIYL